MFGKSLLRIDHINQNIENSLTKWSRENNLVILVKDRTHHKYRFGNPFISNPIYIEIYFHNNILDISGWVGTLIPFLRWKLIEVKQKTLSTKLDYRRKGGLILNLLKEAVTEVKKHNQQVHTNENLPLAEPHR